MLCNSSNYKDLHGNSANVFYVILHIYYMQFSVCPNKATITRRGRGNVENSYHLWTDYLVREWTA